MNAKRENSWHEDIHQKLTCRNEIWEPAGARGVQPTKSTLPSAEEAPSVCSESWAESARPALVASVWPAAASQAPCAEGPGCQDWASRPQTMRLGPTPQWSTPQESGPQPPGVSSTRAWRWRASMPASLLPEGTPRCAPTVSRGPWWASSPPVYPAGFLLSPGSVLLPFQMNCSPCLRSAAAGHRRTQTPVGLGAQRLPGE